MSLKIYQQLKMEIQPTHPKHLATKKYIDDKIEQILKDKYFIRCDDIKETGMKRIMKFGDINQVQQMIPIEHEKDVVTKEYVDIKLNDMILDLIVKEYNKVKNG